MTPKNILLGILLLAAASIAAFLMLRRTEPEEEITPPAYEVADGFNFTLSEFADRIGQVTRIRITPDGTVMLVSTLAENIYAFRKANGAFVRQEQPFFSLKTGLPGFPPEESGLSGMVLGADFEKSGDIFLLYTAAAGEEVLKNRITRITFVERPDGVFGENPAQVFEGNVDSELSHQIQGGVGLLIEGVGHLLFNVGDAVNGKNARDTKKEAGKVLLIRRDGKAPLGPRPFPATPFVQVIGLRNAFDLALDPFDPERRFALGDTGTDRFDRFLYGKIIDLTGKAVIGIDLGWDGTNESLQKNVPDLNMPGVPDMALARWDPTETVDDILFYPGGTGGIPPSGGDSSAVLFSLWGKTGSTDLGPGKKIALGRLTHGARPKLEWREFIRRSEAGAGKLGHPLGLAYDPSDGTIYFGDILEGKMYKVGPIKN